MDNKRIHEGDDNIKQTDDKNVFKNNRKGKKGTAKKKGEEMKEINLVKELSEVVDHFFPEFNKWLLEIKDHRNPCLITYKNNTLIWTGLVMYLTHQESRRQINLEMRRGNCAKGITELSRQKKLDTVPHGDTLEYYINKADVEDFEKLDQQMIQRIVRMRALEGARLQGHYLVAIDGVHVITFDYEHCKNCVKKKNKNGKMQWQHYKVQASLISPDGLCLPMSSEWIENEEFYDKQDCETKATKRLVKKLRRMYPQLKLCILLDSLYSNEPMLKAIEEARMEWIVVFKEGTMPEVYEWLKRTIAENDFENRLEDVIEKEIQSRQKRTHQQRAEREIVMGGTRQQKTERVYTWANEVSHWNNERKYNLLTCEEKVDGELKCGYTWLVSSGIKVNERTVKKVAQSGRCRWVIENQGNNVQKNGGYKLEHLYSRDEVSMKIWIVLLDVAHIISQLLERGVSILKQIYGSSKNIAKRLYEHLRYYEFERTERKRRQIRLFRNEINYGWDTS